MVATRACETIRARSFAAQPETTWREAVADKTAALDARMASVQKAMEVNKEAIDKAVGATEKGVKDAVGSIKTDVEKAVGGIKTDMKDALKLEISAMEKVLKSEVSSVKDAFKSIERIFVLAIAVFIFGKPMLGGIKDIVDAAKEGVSSKNE